MNIIIEKASIQDAATLADLKINIWKSVYRDILPDEYLENLSRDERERKYYKELLDDSDTNIYILKCQQNIIGTLRLKYYQDEDKNSCTSIEDLYILPEYHTQGFGGLAMKFSVNQAIARHCNYLTAWIIKDNTSVRAMAIKYGFFETGKVRIHASTGVKLIQYYLQLSN